MSLEESLKRLSQMNSHSERVVPDEKDLIKVIKKNQTNQILECIDDMVNAALNIDRFVNSHSQLFKNQENVSCLINLETIFYRYCDSVHEVPENVKCLTKKIIDSTRSKAVFYQTRIDQTSQDEIISQDHLTIVLNYLKGGEERLKAFEQLNSVNAYKIIEILIDFTSFEKKIDEDFLLKVLSKLDEKDQIKVLNKIFFDKSTLESLYRKGLKKECFYNQLNQLSPDEVLVCLQRLDPTNGLTKEYADFIRLKYGKSPVEKYFPTGLISKNKQDLDLWKKTGVDLITTQMMSKAFNTRNYEAIDFVLECSEPDWIKKNAPLFLESLSLLEDDKIAEACLKKVPELRLFVSLDFLKQSIIQCQVWFVDWVLKESFFHLPQDFVEECLPIAIKSHNLDLIKLLKKDYENLLKIDEIQGDKNRLLEEVKKYVLMSSLSTVYDLLKVYPQIAEVLVEALQEMSLVVRFPNLLYPTELNEKNSDIDEYFKTTLIYGKENHELIKKIGSNKTHKSLIDEIIKERYAQFSLSERPDKEGYKTRAVESDVFIIKTPLNVIRLDKITPTRYNHSLKHFADLAYDFNLGVWKSKLPYPSVTINRGGVIFHYKTIDNIPITRLTLDQWVHNLWLYKEPKIIESLEFEQERCLREIFNYPLKPMDPQNLKLFFDKVARGYWLIATLCETLRGTPHNTMIWLNRVYRHHNLPPPIPLKDHFFLDNTMLMIPCERAIELWETFFEPTLDNVIEETLLKKLLSLNGLILGLCSAKIRGNKEMIEIAVSQNKEASRFALFS